MAAQRALRMREDTSRPPGLGGPRLLAVVGVLDDGTPHFVPVGEVWAEASRVCCHLCGRWFRSVSAHLPSHGWTRQRYLASFGLEQGTVLECAETRRLRSRAFRPRRTFEPSISAGVAAGHAMARSGVLADRAAKAARGRAHPPQRRIKTLAALDQVSPVARAEGTRRRRRRELDVVGARAAASLGFKELGALVTDRVRRGQSLASTSREAGLHKDWLQRHLCTVCPDVAERLEELRLDPADRRLLVLAAERGFDCVRDLLVERYVDRGRSVHAIAKELGISRYSVESALRRHRVGRGSAT